MFEEENKKKKEIQVTFKHVTQFILHYWRPRKKLGFISVFFMLSAVSMDAVIPVYAGKIIDSLAAQVPDGETAGQAALAAFAIYIGLTFVKLAFRNISILFWNTFAVKTLYSILNEGLIKVQTFSSDWHANMFAGGTVRKITRGMWSFDVLEDTLLMGILPAITIMIGVVIMLSFQLPLVALLTAIMIIVYCTVSIWMSVKILHPRFKASAGADTKVGAVLADIITSNPTVKAFGSEKREESLFKKTADVWYAKAIHAWQTGVFADAARSILRLSMVGSMMFLTITLWSQGKATAGDVVLVMTTFFTIDGYLKDIGMHIAHLQRAISDCEDLISFWLRKSDVVDKENAKPLKLSGKPRHDMISFDRVSFGYPGSENKIYDDLTIDIRSGEKLALVGPSGSGKSTFVKLIQRLYDVTDGRVLVDGQDVSCVTLESLRQSISLVPQDPILFHRSLAENIAYGKPDATMDEIIEAAKKAFAHDFILTLPQGYNTLVGERGIKLSGGERQRVAIARAILADAPILILDEATSSLDSISESYIQKALETLMEGRTTITIAHRLSTIQQSDRILVFDKGRIVEQGTHTRLMTNPKSKYKALYDMQMLDLVEPDEQQLIA